ncbi:MAG: long-chain fatty acid--CoA ligase [Actinobacteria bacterium]|nr:long-chain fatty acid--CoA ligase [Actinomycetota bacterium]
MTAVTALDFSKLDTWPKVLQHNAAHFGVRSKAMRYKHYGIWQAYSWAEYLDNVKYLALGLMAMGFAPGNKLLVVGENSPEWYFAELAAQCLRGVSVGLYADLSAAEIERVARDSEAEFAMVGDQEQADKMMVIIDGLPKLQSVVYWRYKGLGNQQDSRFTGLRSVFEAGRRYEQEHPKAFEEGIAAGKADDVCAIVYTSGVTSNAPKGALHTYRSLMTGSRFYYEADRLGPKDDFACALPPAWITEQWLAFGCHLLSGGTMNFPESSETLQEDLREIAPNVALYNSRLWESESGQVQAKMRGAGWLKRNVAGRLMPVGRRVAGAKYEKRRPNLGDQALNVFADLLAYRQIRDSLGLTKARVCYTSGSSVAPELFRFFHGLKVPLKDVYGSTEAGPVTGAADTIQTPGTVGSINPGVEVKLSDEGEILVQSPAVFAGYQNDPEMTARVLADGWVRTGDKGRMEDGQLVFVDRLQDIMTLPCGDILVPQDIESRLKHSPYIKDAWVVAGQDCPFVSAVIIVDFDNTGRWADKMKTTYTTFGDLSQKPEVYRLIEQEVARVNENLPTTQRIERFVNLHKEFDPDELELTRNRKLRRAFLRTAYADLMTALGGDSTSAEVEAEFTYQDGRTGKIKTALQIATVGQGDR